MGAYETSANDNFGGGDENAGAASRSRHARRRSRRAVVVVARKVLALVDPQLTGEQMQLFLPCMSMRGVTRSTREAYEHANPVPLRIGREQLAFDPRRHLFPFRLGPQRRFRQHRWLPGLLRPRDPNMGESMHFFLEVPSTSFHCCCRPRKVGPIFGGLGIGRGRVSAFCRAGLARLAASARGLSARHGAAEDRHTPRPAGDPSHRPVPVGRTAQQCGTGRGNALVCRTRPPQRAGLGPPHVSCRTLPARCLVDVAVSRLAADHGDSRRGPARRRRLIAGNHKAISLTAERLAIYGRTDLSRIWQWPALSL